VHYDESMHEERYRYKLTVDCMMYCRHFAHAAAAAASLSCSSGGRCAPRVRAQSVQYWLFINPPGIIANLTIPTLPHANFVACVSFASLHWRKNYYFKRSNSVAKLPPYAWTSKNYVTCVCFHCHGTFSYHTTYTLQGRRAKSHVDTQTIQPGLGDFVL